MLVKQLVPGQRKSISQQTDGKEPINTSKQEKKHAGRPAWVVGWPIKKSSFKFLVKYLDAKRSVKTLKKKLFEVAPTILI